MKNECWRYYNHAIIPTIAPHEIVDESPIHNKTIWKDWGKGKLPIMVRWTSDFDCIEKTNWWYVIKDSKFDIDSLKSKRRYEINKGKKNFVVKRIDCFEFLNEIYDVRKVFFECNGLSCETYNKYIENTAGWDKYIFYGAFNVLSGELCGYARLEDKRSYYDFMNLTVKPEFEKKAINAAIISGLLEDLNPEIEKGKYVCDGSRNTLHQTFFQDYLEKYFQFRKAYCKVHIAYPTWMTLALLFLRPMRTAFAKFDSNRLIHRVNAILAMDKIAKEN